MLVANDGYGQPQWEVSLVGDGQRLNFGYNRSLVQARTKGHLLLVVLGWKILAVDTLGAGRGGTPRLLWTQDLMSSGVEPAGLRRAAHAVGQPALAMAAPVGAVLRQDRVCWDRSPASMFVFNGFAIWRPSIRADGQTLWVRQDVPAGSDLFGDEQHLFVLSPDREEATLLRATDGELLGTRKVPRLSGRQMLPTGEKKNVFLHLEEFCLAALGRRLLLWWPEERRARADAGRSAGRSRRVAGAEVFGRRPRGRGRGRGGRRVRARRPVRAGWACPMAAPSPT